MNLFRAVCFKSSKQVKFDVGKINCRLGVFDLLVNQTMIVLTMA